MTKPDADDDTATMVPIRDIGFARSHLTNGQAVRRRAWPHQLRLAVRQGVIMECDTVGGVLRALDRWVPLQADVLALDWELAP